MMRRLGFFATAASMVTAVAVGMMAGSTAHAAPVAPHRPTMVVFGANTRALADGIAYWDRLAGYPVLTYGGLTGEASASTATVTVGDLKPGLAGLTQGNVGDTPLTVTITPAFASDWVTYAHELGHTLGVGHHDEPGYRGVMVTVRTGHVRSSDDRRFVS